MQCVQRPTEQNSLKSNRVVLICYFQSKVGLLDAAKTRVQGPHLHRVVPTDCAASAYPNKQLFIHSHSEGKMPWGSSVPLSSVEKKNCCEDFF